MMPGVTYRKLRSRHWSSMDIAMKSDLESPAAEVFLQIARLRFHRHLLSAFPARSGMDRLVDCQVRPPEWGYPG